MRILAILGAGDLGQLIAYHAKNDNHFDKIVFYDDVNKIGTITKNGEIIGNTKDILNDYKLKKFDKLVIGIGYKHFKARQEFFEKYFEIPFATIVHSSVYVDNSAKIGKGTIILPGCVFDKDVIIGENVFCNAGVIISHDSSIGDHTFIAPCVSIAGFVIVKNRCMLGINTTIIDNLILESDIKTGGGSVIINNLNEPGLYVGVPAKKIK